MERTEQATPTSALTTFPKPGTTLHNMITDPAYRQQFRSKVRQGNRWVVPLYKLGVLPLLGMSKQTMLLTTKGRKSGKLRETPIGYFRIDGTVYLLTGWGKQADWYKNIQACPDQVFVRIGLKRQKVSAEFIQDRGESRHILECLIQEDPEKARAFLGWDPGKDDLKKADFSLAIDKLMFVRFRNAADQ